MTARQHGAGQGARRVRRSALATAALTTATLGASAVAGTVIATAPAGATAMANHGSTSYAWQDDSDHQLHVRGYAYRSGSRSSVNVNLYVDGHYVHTSGAKLSSSTWNRGHHLQGRHGFKSVFRAPAGSHTVSLVANGHVLTTRRITHYASAGSYIVKVARAHVGARYSWGADGPSSFDCSGYAKYVFARTDIAALPHNSESQRHAKHMHAISRSKARPGDLVFYLSGGDAYHVSIYAGHGRQYSATNPSRGVEYSRISSRHVVFGTDWH